MGLDTVELVMEMERAFGITIPDEEAEKIQTVGQAHRYIVAMLSEQPGPEPGPACLTAAMFYRLRRQLMGCLRVERPRIRPDSALEDLFSKRGRRSAWQRLEEALGWRLPGLVRPHWTWLVWGVPAVGFLAAEVVAWGRLGGFAGEALFALLISSVMGLVLLGYAAEWLTRPFATGLPAYDFRGLIMLVLKVNLGTFRMNNPHGWTGADVWQVLVAIIAEQMGYPPERITESTSFVYDLGAD